MATLKDQARKLGRQIRKDTGIPLPAAMGLAKAMVRSKYLPQDSPLRQYTRSVTHCECCGPVKYIEGPKGQTDYCYYGSW